MKIAIAQLNPIIGDLPGNAAKIVQAAERAAAAGAKLLVTPEMSVSGYPPRDLLLRPAFVAAMAEQVEALAAQLPPDLYCLVGYAQPNPRAHQQGEKPLFNSIALLQGGQNQAQFHKQLLPTYDVFDDQRYFASAPGGTVYKIDEVSVGITICEDIWNDEAFWGRRSYGSDPLADLARQGADLIVNVSGSPYSLGKQRLREAMLAHAAKRHGCPIVYVNQVGGNDDLVFDGSSVGINPEDDPVCRAKSFASDFLIVEYDPDAQRLKPALVHPLSESDAAELWGALVLGVRDYVHKCGFSKVLLGLSGGIDSALVAAIATAALGPDNVLGVLMPSPYSSGHSVSDAQELAQNLGIRTETLPIKPLMAGYDGALSKLFDGTEFGVAEENLQSRIRGNLLMALSNKFGYLLLSTGNKSEMAVGYCTLYGDMNGGLAVIADVPKTRVYAICRWLNQQVEAPSSALQLVPQAQEIIPSAIIEKPPSAELKPDQVDQDSLPSYEVLDDILDRLILHHQPVAEVEAAGHERAVIDQVIRLLTRAEFKRRQAAPGIKVTDRAFGTGWRMPIASRVRYT